METNGVDHAPQVMEEREEEEQEEKQGLHDSSNATEDAAAAATITGRLDEKARRLELKKQAILKACDSCNLGAIAELATSTGGLLTDDLRRRAWPILLGSDVSTAPAPSDQDSEAWRGLTPHKDEGQVQLDVDRSFVFYPRGESEKQIDRRRVELFDVIIRTLRTHPTLTYFQGFHDIVQVLLLVLGKEATFTALPYLALLRIRDFMLKDLTASNVHIFTLPYILSTVDAEYSARLEITQPFFAIATCLTLYAHDVQDYGDIARLFDFLLAQEAVVSLYLYVAILLDRRDALMAIPVDEPDMLHSALSKIIPQELDLEHLLPKALKLFSDNPPERLPPWRKVSRYSVLKTTRGCIRGYPASKSSRSALAYGEDLLAWQEAQIGRQRRIDNMIHSFYHRRRPIWLGIGLALSVALLSFVLQKTGGFELTSRLFVRLWSFTPIR